MLLSRKLENIYDKTFINFKNRKSKKQSKSINILLIFENVRIIKERN
jgi:hypothetical protein